MKATLEKTASRLLQALEDLVSQETVLLRAGFYREAIAVQVRAMPRVARLRDIGGEMTAAATAVIGPRISALLERRRESAAYLISQRTSLVAERQRVREARQRLQIIAPYGQASARPARKRLNAAV